jgi:hypothetical protein
MISPGDRGSGGAGDRKSMEPSLEPQVWQKVESGSLSLAPQFGQTFSRSLIGSSIEMVN